MNNDIVVEVDHVSKKYCKDLKQSMLYGVKDIAKNMVGLKTTSHILRNNEFWAIDDVSFTLKKGEALGIIGVNGSGKTTLLKMLNGIFWPDKGKISINGRVGALIAVGAGFHPLLTGRENIYLNASILGMSKDEVNEKFDEIVEFADISDFLDSPVKYYSSGMFVRLGFAVASHCDPDILLIDEILSVGDISFRNKCQKKLRSLQEKHTSIIFVSHSLDAVRRVCDRTLALHFGKMLKIGQSATTLDFYYDFLQQSEANAQLTQNHHEANIIVSNCQVFSSENMKRLNIVDKFTPFIISFDYECKQPIKSGEFVLTIRSEYDNERVALLHSAAVTGKPIDLNQQGTISVTVKNNNLHQGAYLVTLEAYEADNYYPQFTLNNGARFVIKSNDQKSKYKTYSNVYVDFDFDIKLV